MSTPPLGAELPLRLVQTTPPTNPQIDPTAPRWTVHHVQSGPGTVLIPFVYVGWVGGRSFDSSYVIRLALRRMAVGQCAWYYSRQLVGAESSKGQLTRHQVIVVGHIVGHVAGDVVAHVSSRGVVQVIVTSMPRRQERK